MQLFNTQTAEIERFTPRDGNVGLYVCGVTPYDTTHIGHAFTFLTFDILVRYMRHLGWDVTYVQNVTDIDDDILRKAREVGLTWKELGERETARYLKDMADLNWLPPDHYVRATDHVPEMLEIIAAEKPPADRVENVRVQVGRLRLLDPALGGEATRARQARHG